MSETSVPNLRSAMEKTQIWLQELGHDGGFRDERQAYNVLRAVLQALRDRLTVDEAAHLGAQLPLVVRGLYYEGWRPSESPMKQRHLDDFLDAIGARLADPKIDPDKACRATFSLLQKKISAGEIDDVKHMMSSELRGLWPESG